MDKNPDVAELLLLMESVRARQGMLGPQHLEPPEPITQGIPTLKIGVYRNPSPQLAARFAFAGRWEEAMPGLILFDIREMESGAKNHLLALQELQRQPKLKKHHELSPPRRFAPDELSEIGFNDIWSGGIYVIWADATEGEPRIVWYERQHWQEFADLREFFRYLARIEDQPAL